ncbi:hypothetical protein J1605_016614 [Eschrichtius robustus]|uniref:Uncharacterized protein n=1 Tax=Eschrichtius robustus TaxID=9764 RepID=A0AB34I4H1_ESCRO|nr:hypothetical protein J1605_016614 [Eschrichtius robustus]
MGVRGEYSRPGERPPARPLFEEEFTAGAVGPGVAGFKDLRLAKDPGRARGWGSLHLPAGLGESPGKSESELETRWRIGGSREKEGRLCG